MATQGINIVEQALGARPISLSNFSIVGVVGTAPGAAENGTFGNDAGDGIAYNHPFYLTKRSDAPSTELGSTGTLPLALDSIYAQGAVGVVMIIVETVEDGSTLNLDDYIYKINFSNTVTAKEFTYDGSELSFVTSDLTARSTDKAAIEGLAVGQEIVFASGPTIKVTSKAKVEGTHTVVGVTEVTPAALSDGTTYDITATSQNGNSLTRAKVAGVPADNTGVFALQTAQSILGVKPRLLVTPGFDYATGAQNIGSNLKLVAANLRAIAVIDVPDARGDVSAAATALSSDRALLVSPRAKIAVGGTTQNFSMSGFVAGRIAVTDATQGFWTPVGNKQLEGVVGLSVPVDFEMGNPNSGAQTRINAGTMTVVNYGGFRTWGDVSSDLSSAYKFVSVRRIADVLADSVQQNHLWAVSKPIGKNYLSEVSEGVNAFIRSLKAKGALVGGLCYPDGEKNTPEAIGNGEAFFNIEFTPVYPASSITFSVQLTKKYLAELA